MKKKRERKARRLKAIKKARRQSRHQQPPDEGCLRHCLKTLAICPSVARKEEDDGEATEFTMRLSPGTLGMKHNRDDGTVDEVHEGNKAGVAYKVGIEVGMQIVKVN